MWGRESGGKSGGLSRKIGGTRDTLEKSREMGSPALGDLRKKKLLKSRVSWHTTEARKKIGRPRTLEAIKGGSERERGKIVMAGNQGGKR